MIIYLHQEGNLSKAWYGKKAVFHRSVPDSQVEHILVKPTWSMARVVSAIKGKVPNRGSIWQLMINAHGLPGSVQLGTGLTVWTAPEFKALKVYMTPGGKGVLVGSCHAAAGSTGTLPGQQNQGRIRLQSSADNSLTILMLLARHMGVDVSGGLDVQYTWRLNGPLVTAHPDGTISRSHGGIVSSSGRTMCR